MNPPKVGTLITSPQQRDAIHVAIAPVKAAMTLAPGEAIRLTQDGLAEAGEPAIGIVDPFLTGAVKPGEQFWMFMLPGTTTALRHDWAHTALNEQPMGTDSTGERTLYDTDDGDTGDDNCAC